MPLIEDAFGNPLTLADAASLGPVNDFIEGFAASEARVVQVLALADRDNSPIVQALCAALHMFAEAPEAPQNAQRFIGRALASSIKPSPREASLVAAIADWVQGRLDQAVADRIGIASGADEKAGAGSRRMRQAAQQLREVWFPELLIGRRPGPVADEIAVRI